MLCVENEVGDDLTELVGIGAEHRQVGGEVGSHSDAGRADPVRDKLERGANDLIQVDWLFSRTALACHGEKTFDDAAATLCRRSYADGATSLFTTAILLEHQCLTDDDR